MYETVSPERYGLVSGLLVTSSQPDEVVAEFTVVDEVNTEDVDHEISYWISELYGSVAANTKVGVRVATF